MFGILYYYLNIILAAPVPPSDGVFYVLPAHECTFTSSDKSSVGGD